MISRSLKWLTKYSLAGTIYVENYSTQFLESSWVGDLTRRCVCDRNEHNSKVTQMILKQDIKIILNTICLINLKYRCHLK